MDRNIIDNVRLENWDAPNVDLLPDFIIGGAMKSGTTTLHQILDKHPRIFIPKEEIGFFDVDNRLQHGDFSFYHKKEDKWISQNMIDNPQKIWEWYLQKFSGKENFVKGEDSTTYLASRIAAERISIQKKEIKLIFLLRQPSIRAYSNYCHMLRTGTVVYDFENTIRYNPHSVLNRSLYKDQLENYYHFIPRERIKIVLFEELIENTEKVIREVCDFIQIDFNEFSSDVLETHANKSRLILSLNVQIKINYLLSNLRKTLYIPSLPNAPEVSKSSGSFVHKVVKKVYSILNSRITRKTPKMSPATKSFLDEYFYSELEGIDKIANKDILSKWF